MGLVNVSVVEVESRRLLLQWKIISVEPPDVTFSIFFEDTVRPLLNQRDSESVLKKAFVGSDKNSLDETDISLPVVKVTKAFGQFVKFTIQSREPNRILPTLNAFEVLIQNQQRLSVRLSPLAFRTQKIEN